jgi:hypothetical protein
MSFDDEALERTLDALTDRLREDIARQVRASAAELADAARLAEEKRVAAAMADAAATASELGRVRDGLKALSSARSLTEILGMLIEYARSENTRIALMLARGDRFRSWRLVGFEGSGDNVLDIDAVEAGVVARAASTGDTARGNDAPAFARTGSEPPCVAVPLIVGGRVVAVLYADAANGDFGNVSAEPLEILCLHAARCLEAMTATKAAHALLTPPHAAAAADTAQTGTDADENEYAAARRYARILVAEIKLYHEDQVTAGRRERDLANRLGGEIARVRALYDERVPRHVRQRTDYVREELIGTLAGGDASLLEAKAEA